MGLKQYVESGVHLGMSDYQTRILAGAEWHDSAYGKCPDEALEVVKANFKRDFAVIGLTERFDETLLLLRRAFGWNDLFYTRQNITRQRPRINELSADTLAAIVDVNQVDIKLYQYVKKLFDEEVREQGPFFKFEVQAFKLLNRFIGSLLYGDQKSQDGSLRRLARRAARLVFPPYPC
jgi:hypothetical protein